MASSRTGFTAAARRTWIAAAVLLLPVAASASGPVRRTDLFTSPSPGELTAYPPARIGGVVYFPGNDVTNGSALWANDESGGRSVLLRGLSAQTPVPLHGQAFFLGNRSTDARLWRTDGTQAGTKPVASVGDGYRDSGLTAVGELLYLVGGDGLPWASDGTPQGTLPLAESSRIASVYAGFVEGPGAVYFIALGADAHLTLWSTRGTVASTGLVADLGPQAGYRLAYGLTHRSGRLFFFTSEEPFGARYRLWVSDASASGTQTVRDFQGTPRFCMPPLQCSALGPETLPGDDPALLLLADDGVHGRELWRSDGTAATTALLADIRPGPESGSVASSLDPHSSGRAGPNALFAADDGVHGTELWRTDGTGAGTNLVADLVPGPLGSGPFGFVSLGATAFFTADDAIWRTDGTASGTTLFRQGTAQLSAIDGGFAAIDQDGLWTSDGVTFTLVDDLARPRGLRPFALTIFGNEVFFSRLDEDGSFDDVWRFDETVGARVIHHFQSLSVTPVVAGSAMYLGADDGVHGVEPWVSDGTEAGTRLLRDIAVPRPNYPGAVDSDPGDFTAAAGRVFFTASEGVHGVELWTTDGTEAGTRLVEDFNPGDLGSVPGFLTPFGHDLAFTIFAPGGLWRSDATESGTSRISAVAASDLVKAGGRLFFAGTDPASGSELWTSDGTPEGTRLVRDITPGPDGSNLFAFTPASGRVFFMAQAADGTELWTSDGTTAGTRSLGNFRWLLSLTAANGGIYFAADDREHGLELWRSDGTPEGTRLVRDIAPGAAASNPEELAVVNGRLFFAADDGEHGAELWTSDGTEAGTVMVMDISPGPYSSRPGEFRASPEIVYFRASDEETGAQLWSMAAPDLDPRPGQRPRPTHVVPPRD